MTTEQQEILARFASMLALPTQDGQRKRQAGTKPLWKYDPDHTDAMYRHLKRWENGEGPDPDSGAHPLIHVAWRALALAAQETMEADAD